VRTDHLLRTPYVQLAVARDVVMVAAHLEAAGAVTGIEGLEGERAVAARYFFKSIFVSLFIAFVWSFLYRPRLIGPVCCQKDLYKSNF
jgi:hypothetical protein